MVCVNRIVLAPIRGEEITEPGWYLCHPVVGMEDQPLFAVRVEADGDMLLYYPSDDGEARVVTTSGYTFFRIPKELQCLA
jgi:hypothetical protein